MCVGAGRAACMCGGGQLAGWLAGYLLMMPLPPSPPYPRLCCQVCGNMQPVGELHSWLSSWKDSIAAQPDKKEAGLPSLPGVWW